MSQAVKSVSHKCHNGGTSLWNRDEKLQMAAKLHETDNITIGWFHA